MGAAGGSMINGCSKVDESGPLVETNGRNIRPSANLETNLELQVRNLNYEHGPWLQP